MGIASPGAAYLICAFSYRNNSAAYRREALRDTKWVNRLIFKKQPEKEKQKQENGLWRTLLDCLSAITEMHPWKQLDAGAPFAYIPEDGERVILFHCVQDAPDSMGIVVFPSPGDYSGRCRRENHCPGRRTRFHRNGTVQRVSDPPGRNAGRNVESIPPACGGLQGWAVAPGAIHKRRGYLGRVPEGEALAFLLDCLGNFHMELKALQAGHIKPDFANGEMLLRYYSPADKLWMNVIAPFSLPEELPHPIIFREDSAKLRELRALPAAKYRPAGGIRFRLAGRACAGQSRRRTLFPVQVVLTDRQTDEVLCLYHCRPDDLMDCAFTAWSEVIHTHGLPETLYVCRNDSYDLFEDLTQKLGVNLKRVKRLPAAERVLRNLGAV